MKSNLGWLKKFGPAQNILGPVKGQGICLTFSLVISGPEMWSLVPRPSPHVIKVT